MELTQYLRDESEKQLIIRGSLANDGVGDVIDIVLMATVEAKHDQSKGIMPLWVLRFKWIDTIVPIVPAHELFKLARLGDEEIEALIRVNTWWSEWNTTSPIVVRRVVPSEAMGAACPFWMRVYSRTLGEIAHLLPQAIDEDEKLALKEMHKQLHSLIDTKDLASREFGLRSK